jgi:peptide deformylase
MICELMHDPLFLAKKSVPATAEDLQVARDLMDTLMHHRETCVGMAANMIGVCKNIIAVNAEGTYLVLLNPQILKAEGPYQTQESCLSLLGGPRPVGRYEKIKVQYQNEKMQTRIKTFTGWTAQIIQHEIDHCNGILI